MCRKLTLTGWVLLINEEYEQARVLAALLASVTFMVLHFAIKPHGRPADGALVTMAELALVLIYTCVLLIKTCDFSSIGTADRAALLDGPQGSDILRAVRRRSNRILSTWIPHSAVNAF